MSQLDPESRPVLLRACRLEPTPYTPIWLMRQAGRYMPEYRRVRERYGFLEMCQRPELAAEVTVTAAERLGVDGAIIFADLLLPLLPMDLGLRYDPGDGPVIERRLGSAQDVARLKSFTPAEELGFVAEAIRMVRSALSGRIPVIGFAGAPFTLASYLIEGGASRNYLRTKRLMYSEPAVWHALMGRLIEITADYIKLQVEAGAEVVQLFDSWIGTLGVDDYRSYVLEHVRALLSALAPDVPIIHFGTGTAHLLELMHEAGGNVIGIDWRPELGEAWARIGYQAGIQGNLDPAALLAPIPEIRRRAKAILESAGGRCGHIFNLGHGILPETPVDHVLALVETVHESSQR